MGGGSIAQVVGGLGALRAGGDEAGHFGGGEGEVIRREYRSEDAQVVVLKKLRR